MFITCAVTSALTVTLVATMVIIFSIIFVAVDGMETVLITPLRRTLASSPP